MSDLTPDETILGLLALRPRHGYELLEIFRQPSQLGRVWQLSTSQLYAVLKRLERNGWITGQEIRTPNAPPRNEYCLTETGTARLHAWLDTPDPSTSMQHLRIEFLSRLFIARGLNQPTQQLVRRQRKACQQALDALVAERSTAEVGVEFLALEFQIAQLETALMWIARCDLIEHEDDL